MLAELDRRPERRDEGAGTKRAICRTKEASVFSILPSG
jgi:hypothetical protein